MVKMRFAYLVILAALLDGCSLAHAKYAIPTTTNPDCGPENPDTWTVDKDMLAQLKMDHRVPDDVSVPFVIAGMRESLGTLFEGSTLPLRIEDKQCIDLGGGGSSVLIVQKNHGDPHAKIEKFAFVLADKNNPFVFPAMGQSIAIFTINGKVVGLTMRWSSADANELFEHASQVVQIIDQSKWVRDVDPDANLYSRKLQRSYASADAMKKEYPAIHCYPQLTPVVVNGDVFATWERAEPFEEQDKATKQIGLTRATRIQLSIQGCNTELKLDYDYVKPSQRT